MENENQLLRSILVDLESLSEYDPTIKKLLSSSERKLQIANGKMGGGGGKSSSRTSNVLTVLFGLLTLLFAIMGTYKYESSPIYAIAKHAKNTVNELSTLILKKHEIEVTKPFLISINNNPIMGTIQRTDKYALLPKELADESDKIISETCKQYIDRPVDDAVVIFDIQFKNSTLYIDYADANILDSWNNNCLKSAISTFSEFQVKATELILYNLAAFNLHEEMIKSSDSLTIAGIVQSPKGFVKRNVKHQDPYAKFNGNRPIILAMANELPTVSTYITANPSTLNDTVPFPYKTVLSPYSSFCFPNSLPSNFNFDVEHSIPYTEYNTQKSEIINPEKRNIHQDNKYQQILRKMYYTYITKDKTAADFVGSWDEQFLHTSQIDLKHHNENMLLEKAVIEQIRRQAFQIWSLKLPDKIKEQMNYVKLSFSDNPLFEDLQGNEKIIINGRSPTEGVAERFMDALRAGSAESKNPSINHIDFSIEQFKTFFKATASDDPSNPSPRQRIEDLKSVPTSLHKKGGRTRTSKKRKGRKRITRKQSVDLLRKFFKI